jgi:hypothetical protein
MRYGTVHEEAAALEAVIADRYPAMTPEDRAMFAAAVLYKVTDLYRRGGTVVLESYDSAGRPVGRRPLVIEES